MKKPSNNIIIRNERIEREREKKKENLEAVNGEKTAKNAFLETSTQHYHIILFLQRDEIPISDPNANTRREKEMVRVLSLTGQ